MLFCRTFASKSIFLSFGFPFLFWQVLIRVLHLDTEKQCCISNVWEDSLTPEFHTTRLKKFDSEQKLIWRFVVITMSEFCAPEQAKIDFVISFFLTATSNRFFWGRYKMLVSCWICRSCALKSQKLGSMLHKMVAHRAQHDCSVQALTDRTTRGPLFLVSHVHNRNFWGMCY